MGEGDGSGSAKAAAVDSKRAPTKARAGCKICFKVFFFIYLTIFRYSPLRVAFDIERTKVMPQRRPRFLWPRRNVRLPRLGLIRTRGSGFLEKNHAPQAMGTGVAGEYGRDSAVRFRGRGNWNGALTGTGRRLASLRAKSSIFLVADKISGAFFSCFLASLIESHMLQGCSPSKVFFAPARTEPSCVE